MTSAVNFYPPELLSLICAHIHAAGLPPSPPCLDPLIHSEGVPTSLPSSYPPSHWPESTVRSTLSSLCLVNHAWYDAAKPWLWQKVEIRLPRSWMALVEEISGGDDEFDEQSALLVGQSIQEAESAAALAAKHLLEGSSSDFLVKELHEKLMASLSGPHISIPPELLSPPATRDPSPRRLRAKSKSPVRWKLMRSINDAVQNFMGEDNHGIYIPTPQDPHPGRFIHHLDFNHFRTIGMRRSVEEGVNNRFVTGDRLQSVLKELPNLAAFGATEYMDGAMALPVLQELLMRGSPSRGRGRPSRGRDLIVSDPNNPEEEDRERRREYKELEALDLTGCVSAVFVHALTDFVNTHLVHNSDSDSSGSEDEGPRERRRGRPLRTSLQDEPLLFPGLQRLGLRGVKSIQSHILNAFVLAFPSLTHLDLSCTRVTPDLLSGLGTSSTVRLQSLALERCNWLTGESIRTFLIEAPCTQTIRELSLYGDYTFPSPLSQDDLEDIFARAPCFKSGQLIYLDLSSAPITRHMLHNVCASQPSLRSLGLSYIPNLEISSIADFLKTKAFNVEILTLVMTCPELGYGEQHVAARQATVTLHTQLIRPLCTPPFSFSLSSPSPPKAEPPTHLRVIEFASPLLSGLGAGADSWRIVKSKGSRGWYVDTASGWIAEDRDGSAGAKLRRDLPKEHPWRIELERLADANGNVTSGVGWHARKMEVLHGYGLLGRESGLYGAVSFAYQG
ncbi:F-box domain-containing protein [Abortiporus biennis]